jgi:hypothetical protein
VNHCSVCSVKVTGNNLMCVAHWRMVPATLQGQVLSLWKVTTRGRNPSIRRMAMEEYRKAREAAIAAVREKVTS